ncbi:PIG-L deacetylase family protein [Paraburkholderia sp.]|jgi:LmbE family N-acetylglucosaminyl deacetylase|uniref:PIG-L deacetylase family protein n=1 Tax=Paraburkholderia sp. TaxID=1926495 RepID=UPI002F42E145
MESNPRLLAISPHLDDAVLSCGLLLAAHPNAFVCTVFTAPPATDMTTEWDQAAGFTGAFEAMRARRAEDREALACVGARPVHLRFCDAQYQTPPAPDALNTALHRAVLEAEPTTMLIPLGLFHSDHLLVADACLTLMQRHPAVSVVAYEDVPYRSMPGAVQDRLCELGKRGYLADTAQALDTTVTPRHEQMKRAALDAYRSQLRAFGADASARLFSPERYWRLSMAKATSTGWRTDRNQAASVT